MDEHELKFMIDRDGYEKCLYALSRLCTFSGRERLIVNYYYDTPDLSLHDSGITLRVRQCGSELQGQVKRHDKGASTDSSESYFEVVGLPRFIRFEKKKVELLGSLTTVRTSFEIDGMKAEVDRTFYLGKTDYELEIEFPEGEEERARSLAASLEVPFLAKRGGKCSRFLKALRQLKERDVLRAEPGVSDSEL